jgi:hypothetical protein
MIFKKQVILASAPIKPTFEAASFLLAVQVLMYEAYIASRKGSPFEPPFFVCCLQENCASANKII